MRIHLGDMTIINTDNDASIIRIETIVTRKEYLLNDFRIIDFRLWKPAAGFYLWLRTEKIRLNYTKVNYSAIIEVMKATHYAKLNDFITKVSAKTVDPS